MSNTLKIDPNAFSRGVDEVILMKPVRRVVVSMLGARFGWYGEGQDAGVPKPDGSRDVSKRDRKTSTRKW